ncbi:Maltodextrin utilization protein YvdJ [Amphibacillus marinus]|uniref:Maltodextrin utilization protein YvdJ n=1 Tax=Amphibacillus marinus TaxID=872970 RepID=A0A1H8MW49_9BACI|nr:DUF1189 family protein [Amphibacillus marinus]SEO21453.1 Maltodextrin utilization protein YvdJ [Amphibacillus marinus]
MTIARFPFNYFINIVTPTRAFLNRRAIGWPTIVILLVFLNALITIPVSLHFAKSDEIGIEQFYPKSFKMIDAETHAYLSDIANEDGVIQTESAVLLKKEEGVVSIGEPNEEVVEDHRVTVIFKADEFIIKEDSLPELSVFYTTDFSPDQTTPAELRSELNRQWRINNQVYIVAIMTFLISSMTFIMLVFLVMGSALFLYVTKKSQLTSITSYKESVAIILYGLGIPTFVAFIFGLVQFDIIWMMTIQTIGLAIMIVMMYFKTKFSDREQISI